MSDRRTDSLSHSCPTCEGKGVLGGCGRDDCDHTHTLMFCLDCNPQPQEGEEE